MIHVCDVCRLVDNDLTEKESEFCEACDAWICTADLDNWPRRVIAMNIRWLGEKERCEQCLVKLKSILKKVGREDLIARFT